MEKDVWRELFQPKNKKAGNTIFLILLIGVMLLLLGGSLFPSPKQESSLSPVEIEEKKEEVHRKEEYIETKMEEILSKVHGAGEVDVMLTFSSTEEKIIAKDKTIEESHSTGETEETTKNKEVKSIMVEDSSGSRYPYILMENNPQIEGVVVVAQGGDSAVTCEALNSAVQALLDVEAHKIAILKMK